MTPLRTAIAILLLATAAQAGPIAGAKDAVDPDCTPSKAVKGAAMKATVGVGNRCDVAETARDTVGVDGKVKDAKSRNGDGPIKKIKD